MFDYIKCDYPLPLTEEIKRDLPKEDWPEVNFQTKSLGCFLENHSIEEDGQIYAERVRRELSENNEVVEINEGIEKLDWSGELFFYFDFVKEEHDILIEFKALVWKGDLKEI